jgi:hypothetical protein
VTKSLIEEDLVRAYRNTRYCVFDPNGSFELFIDRPSANLGELLKRGNWQSALFITAANPYSELLCEADNAVRHDELRDALHECAPSVIEGEGRGVDGNWPAERSFLALDVTHQKAIELGEAFQQNAVVWSADDTIPRLLLLR